MTHCILLGLALTVAVTTPTVVCIFDTPLVAPPPPAPAPTAATMLPKIVASIKAGATPTANDTDLDSFVSAVKATTKLVGTNGTLTPAQLDDFVTKVVTSLGGAMNTSETDQVKLKAFVAEGLDTCTHDIDGVVQQVALGANLLGNASRVTEALQKLILIKQVYAMGFPVALPDAPDEVLAQALHDLGSILDGFGFSAGTNLTPTYVSTLGNGVRFPGGQVAGFHEGYGSLFSNFFHGAGSGSVGGGVDLTKVLAMGFGGGLGQGAAGGAAAGGIKFDVTQMLGGFLASSQNHAGSGGSTQAGNGLDLTKLIGGMKPAAGGQGGFNLASVVGNLFG